MKKRVISILLSAAMILSLAACGGQSSSGGSTGASDNADTDSTDGQTYDWSIATVLAASPLYEDALFYLENPRVQALGLWFTPAVLGGLHAVYDGVTELCQNVYENAILTADHSIDLEVSLDKTAETTSPEAHYYVAGRLERAGVFVTSITPRFVGEFQKAIGYIGDTDALREAMALHAAVANCLGHKLSLHSGSEKFTAMPILAEATGGRYHIKTSGTSWLEAVETISKHAPALYRRMHRAALEGIGDARRHYEVHCDLRNVPPLDTVEDAQLPEYLTQNDARQLMHITLRPYSEQAGAEGGNLPFPVGKPGALRDGGRGALPAASQRPGRIRPQGRGAHPRLTRRTRRTGTDLALL